MRRHITALVTALLVTVLMGLVLPAAAADRGQGRHDATSSPERKDKAHASRNAGREKGEKADPPGNNGTVKIAPAAEKDETPDNNPHPGCAFRIEWYGFDEGADIWSTVRFVMQAPTSDVDLSGAPTESERVFVGGDPATGAGTETGLDGVKEYRLSFDGAPHPQQGYHVKLTVHTPYSHGADTKHKVYWVEPCDEETEEPGTAPAATEGEQGPEGESDTGGDTGGGDTGDDVSGEQADVETEVLGAQAATQTNAGTQPGNPAAGQAGASAEVPTSVDAGRSGDERLRSVLPALIILLGLAVSGAAWVRRRRSRA